MREIVISSIKICFIVLTLLWSACLSTHWQILLTEEESHAPAIAGLYFSDGLHGWMIAHSLLETHDGGKTWSKRLDNDGSLSLHSLAFANSNVGWIVGAIKEEGVYKTLVFKTSDAGKTWQRQETPILARQSVYEEPYLHSVCVCGVNTSYSVGRNIIVRTVDGGKKWELSYIGEHDLSLYGVYCRNDIEAWAVGTEGTILHTQDGGKSWQLEESGTKGALNKIVFDRNNGLIVGMKGTVLGKSNSSTPWLKKELNISDELTDCHLRRSEGWIVGFNGIILHTEDGGQNWQPQGNPTNQSLLTVFFINSQIGWAGGKQKTLLRYH